MSIKKSIIVNSRTLVFAQKNAARCIGEQNKLRDYEFREYD